MNRKMEMLILMLVLIGGKSHGKPHKMEDAANQEKEEPSGDDVDCPGNQHIHGDQEETSGAFRRQREVLDGNFDENSVDQESATHHLNLNKNEEAVNMDCRDDEDEDCLIDDEDCDKHDGDDNDDGAIDDDNDRERRIGKENGNRNSSSEFVQPNSGNRIVPDNSKADYIYF